MAEQPKDSVRAKAEASVARLKGQVGNEFAIHDTDHDTDDYDLPEDRPCSRCGKNPAEGFASIWTQRDGERWFCHGDDDGPTCYEGAA